MKFEELQREWDSIKSEPKSHDEIRRMMYSSPARRFRSLTREQIWGLTWNGLFVLVAIFLFDALNHWISILSIVWCIVQALDRYLGLRYLRFFPQESADTIRDVLTKMLAYIRRRAITSSVINAGMWLALVIILGTGVYIGTLNIVRWALILLPVLAAVMWWNARTWSKQRNEVMATLKEFDEEAGAAAV